MPHNVCEVDDVAKATYPSDRSDCIDCDKSLLGTGYAWLALMRKSIASEKDNSDQDMNNIQSCEMSQRLSRCYAALTVCKNKKLWGSNN